MTVVFGIVAGLLGAAGLITLLRLLRGPSALDRVVAMDTLLAIILCSLASIAAWTLDSTPVTVVVAVSLVGFVGSVSVARFIAPQMTSGAAESSPGTPAPTETEPMIDADDDGGGTLR